MTSVRTGRCRIILADLRWSMRQLQQGKLRGAIRYWGEALRQLGAEMALAGRGPLPGTVIRLRRVAAHVEDQILAAVPGDVPW